MEVTCREVRSIQHSIRTQDILRLEVVHDDELPMGFDDVARILLQLRRLHFVIGAA